ncbi:UNVERIFIED_CONTAM: hypothetical protein K2H54_069339 [Gekko kuhli]
MESAEWKILENLILEDVVPQIGQLVFEIHVHWPGFESWYGCTNSVLLTAYVMRNKLQAGINLVDLQALIQETKTLAVAVALEAVMNPIQEKMNTSRKRNCKWKKSRDKRETRRTRLQIGAS